MLHLDRRASSLAVALAFFMAPAACPGQSPSSSPAATAPTTSADPLVELQQLEAAALAVDPAAPDAMARLRELLARLARVSAHLAREVALLREAQSRAAARPASTAAKPAGAPGKAPAKAVPAAAATAVEAGSANAAAPFFARRGLKKFHRVGCHFGERVNAEDRVRFANPAEAAAAGLEPCKVCSPILRSTPPLTDR